MSKEIKHYDVVQNKVMEMVSQYITGEGEYVYDLGAAPGVLMARMFKAHPKLCYYAVDNDMEKLKLLRSAQKFTARNYSVQHYDLNNTARKTIGSDFVSVIFECYVLSELFKSTAPSLFKQNYQELRKGGALFVCDTDGTAEEKVIELQKVGFADVLILFNQDNTYMILAVK